MGINRYLMKSTLVSALECGDDVLGEEGIVGRHAQQGRSGCRRDGRRNVGYAYERVERHARQGRNACPRHRSGCTPDGRRKVGNAYERNGPHEHQWSERGRS